MYLKVMGAGLILVGCGGCGMRIAWLHRREVAALHQLLDALDGMLCELEYHLTPLPELCRLGAEYASGAVGKFLENLAAALDTQLLPDVRECTRIALRQTGNLPPQTALELEKMGQTLGRFDLQGQVNVLHQAKTACLNCLEKLEYRQDQRLRSYQTLGFCAGAALAILLF